MFAVKVDQPQPAEKKPRLNEEDLKVLMAKLKARKKFMQVLVLLVISNLSSLTYESGFRISHYSNWLCQVTLQVSLPLKNPVFLFQ